MTYEYIVSTPGILGGKPCIKGTRISVELILETIADGASVADIVEAFPRLPTEAVQKAIRYATDVIRQTTRSSQLPDIGPAFDWQRITNGLK